MAWLKIIQTTSEYLPKYIAALQETIRLYEDFLGLFFEQMNRSPKNLNVLVVDPSEKNRILVGHYLLNKTNSIQFARNDVDALERIKSGSYDLVIFPHQMKLDLPEGMKKGTYRLPLDKKEVVSLVMGEV